MDAVGLTRGQVCTTFRFGKSLLANTALTELIAPKSLLARFRDELGLVCWAGRSALRQHSARDVGEADRAVAQPAGPPMRAGFAESAEATGAYAGGRRRLQRIEDRIRVPVLLRRRILFHGFPCTAVNTVFLQPVCQYATGQAEIMGRSRLVTTIFP